MKTLILILTMATGEIDRTPMHPDDCLSILATYTHMGAARREDGVAVLGMACETPRSFVDAIRPSDGDCEVMW